MSFGDERTMSNAEYQEFEAWKTERIRSEERAKAQTEAAKVNLEQEAAADRAALAALESHGVSLSECFGYGVTQKGQNAIKLIFQRGQGVGSQKHYPRLRALAAARGLVK